MKNERYSLSKAITALLTLILLASASYGKENDIPVTCHSVIFPGSGQSELRIQMALNPDVSVDASLCDNYVWIGYKFVQGDDSRENNAMDMYDQVLKIWPLDASQVKKTDKDGKADTSPDGIPFSYSQDLKPIRLIIEYDAIESWDESGQIKVPKTKKSKKIVDCFWDQDNREIKDADKEEKGSLSYMGLEGCNDDWKDTYNFTRPSDGSIAAGTEDPGRCYCIQVVSEYDPNIEMTISGSIVSKNQPFINNKRCTGAGDEKKCVYRCYVDNILEGDKLDIDVSFSCNDTSKAVAVAYSIAVMNVQPVITIHEIGDGPEEVADQSEWMKSFREKLPYSREFVPAVIHEFAWNSGEYNTLEAYAGSGEWQLGKYIRTVGMSSTKKPIINGYGVGGLIIVEEMKKDDKLLERAKRIVFLNTPFFGTEIGGLLSAVVNEKGRMSKKKRDKLLKNTLAFGDVASSYVGYEKVSDGILEELGRGKANWRKKDEYSKLPLNDKRVIFVNISGTTESLKQNMDIIEPNILKHAKDIVDIIRTSAAVLDIVASAYGIPAIVSALSQITSEYYIAHYEECSSQYSEMIASQLFLKGDGVTSIPSSNLPKTFDLNKPRVIGYESKTHIHSKTMEIFNNKGFMKDDASALFGAYKEIINE